MKQLIMKVFASAKTKQKFVTIPKNHPIKAGDYVTITIIKPK